MFDSFQLIAQAAEPNGFSLMGLIPIGLVIVVFYFIVMRPQAQKREEQQKKLDSLMVGDEVVTVGGILGTIKNIDDPIVTLEISKGIKIKILRNRIKGTKSSVLNTGADKSA